MTSKCLKVLLNSSILSIASLAGMTLLAHADQNLVLRSDQKVQFSCSTGATPYLKDNTIQCGQTCTLIYPSKVAWDQCKTDECRLSLDFETVKLTQDGSEKTLFKGIYSGLEIRYALMSFEEQFANKCDLIKIKETHSSTLPAFAGRNLVLQSGQKVKVSCASGTPPVMKGNIVRCAQTCTLNYFRETSWSNCDQGGCWGREELSNITLTEDSSGKTLYSNSASNTSLEQYMRDLQTEFANQCDIINVNETSEPGWHH